MHIKERYCCIYGRSNAQAVKDYRKSEKYSDGFPPATAAIFGRIKLNRRDEAVNIMIKPLNLNRLSDYILREESQSRA